MSRRAINVDDVSKVYRVYTERNQSLKSALLRRGRIRYDEFQALDHVSLEVAEGTTFGVIGENGSGKSTLLKCMARILRPDTGRIEVVGKVSALLELGAGFHPELSGRENVYLNGTILGLSKKAIDRKFDEIVGFAGLETFIDAPVKNYSSGMYVRLGFSVAINVDPDVLLVDEVLAVGDENFMRKCSEKFAELRREGTTIVIVSHGLESVRRMCEQVAWLDHGVLQKIGDTGEVVDSYIDEVHVDRQADVGGKGSRWGSGEERIETVELLDPRGESTTRVHTGDRVTVRLHYAANQTIERPVFGLALHTVDGFHVSGPNTREADCVPDRIEGKGTVDFVVDHLMLLPGTYDITVALTDYGALHPFDYRHRALRFDVDPGTPHETFGGVVSLGGHWRVDALDRAT